MVNETKRVVTLDLWINARLVYCLSRKKVWWFWSGTDGQIFPRCLTQAWIIICNLNLAATKLGISGYLGLVIVCVGTFYLAQTCEQNCSLVSIRVKYHNLWLMSFYDFPVFLFSKSDCVFSVRARETQPTERYSAASHTASLNSRVPSAPYMFYSHTYWRQRGFWLKWQLFGPVPLFFCPLCFLMAGFMEWGRDGEGRFAGCCWPKWEVWDQTASRYNEGEDGGGLRIKDNEGLFVLYVQLYLPQAHCSSSASTIQQQRNENHTLLLTISLDFRKKHGFLSPNCYPIKTCFPRPI